MSNNRQRAMPTKVLSVAKASQSIFNINSQWHRRTSDNTHLITETDNHSTYTTYMFASLNENPQKTPSSITKKANVYKFHPYTDSRARGW